MVIEAFSYIAEFQGVIPGSTRQQCGNYKEHSLDGAKKIAKDMLAILTDWSEEKMQYRSNNKLVMAMRYKKKNQKKDELERKNS